MGVPDKGDKDYIEYDPSQFTTKELRSVVAGTSRTPPVPPPIAVRMLRLKLGLRATDELAEIAAAEEYPVRVRRQAISELAEIHEDRVARLLEDLLDSDEKAIVRAAVAALGRVGDETSLRVLNQKSLPDQAVPVIEMATMLISARVGVDLPVSARHHDRNPVSINKRDSEPVEIVAPQEETVRKVVADLDALGLPMAPAAAMEFRCAGKSLMFLPSDPGFLTQLPETVGFVGVVAGFDAVETEKWTPELYVVVDPRANRSKPQIELRRRSGQVVYSGTFDTQTGSFVVETESAPGVTPIEAIGRYAAGEVVIESARTGVRATEAIALLEDDISR